jgi:hypothetical protein
MNYDEALGNYLNVVRELIDKYWTYNDFHHERPQVGVEPGRVYDKVVKYGSQSMVHSFVRKSDGAILKAKSWRGPDTKHVRGSIYADDGGRSAITWTGAKYL